MFETEDDWSVDSRGAEGSGLLRRSIANVVVLLAVCLAVVLGVSQLTGGPGKERRVASSPTPRPAQVQQSAAYENEIAIPVANNGHFIVDAEVDRVDVRFLVDTGASSIILNRKDAAELGFNADRLQFTQRFQTANGEVLAAPVTLREVRIGALELDDVAAVVLDTPMAMSLLGMPFLQRLRSYEVRDERLVLRW